MIDFSCANLRQLNIIMILSKIRDLLTSDYKYIKNKFYTAFGYFPDLKNPRTFNEKINCRKLYGRKKSLNYLQIN